MFPVMGKYFRPTSTSTGYAVRWARQRLCEYRGRAHYELGGGHERLSFQLPAADATRVCRSVGNCDSGVTSGSTGFCQKCSESSNCNSLFPSDNDVYWSSSLYVRVGTAWGTYFGSGYVGWRSVADDGYARCVRSVP